MTTSPKTRLDWVDTAKGISIFLVVLIHARRWLEFVGANAAWISEFNALFMTVRMPLFFAMSGLLAQRWVRDKSWRELFSGKLALLVWVFIVWQPIVFIYKYSSTWFIPNQEDSSVQAHILRAVISPLRPNGELWFLWALVIFFLIAKATRSIPVWLQLTLSGLVSAGWLSLAPVLFSESMLRQLGDGWNGLFSYYFFFLCALLLRSEILRVTSASRWWNQLIMVFVWIGVYVLVTRLAVDGIPGVQFLLRVAGFSAGISLALLLHRITVLKTLGRQTLPIYLAHTFFVVGIVCILRVAGFDLSGPIASGITPWSLAVVAMAISLALHKVANRGVGTLLYAPPHAFAHVLSKTPNVPPPVRAQNKSHTRE